ncbi:hypothetical protein CQA38_08785 [Campylobacter sp. MIT 12-5580]|nr:hypothetical protein CQA38_08785 [Campylobacter sp. MIT 12-5580]
MINNIISFIFCYKKFHFTPLLYRGQSILRSKNIKKKKKRKINIFVKVQFFGIFVFKVIASFEIHI